MIPEKLYCGLLKSIFITMILSWMIVTASAVESSPLQWGTGISSKQLLRGETISYMGFSVKVTGFSEPVESGKYTDTPMDDVMPFVSLNISKNGIFINSTALTQGDSYIDPDGELRITANQLPAKNSSEWLFESYKPWVVLDLTPRGKPDIQVAINTDHDEYTSMSVTNIVATVTLQNTGEADAIDVDLNIATQLEIIRGELKYHFEKVQKGQSIVEEIVFSSPVVSKLKTYNISANVSGSDVKDLHYKADFLKNIKIAPEGLTMPSLRKSANSKIYLKDSIMVSLTLKNNRKEELKNVSITDVLPEGFKLIGNSSLNWSATIAPYGEWNARYLLKPIEANKEVLPSAKAEFTFNNEFFAVSSNRPEILVYGPKIVLTKKSDRSEIDPNESIIVTIVAHNDGNTPTKVMITDNLPNLSIVTNGSTYYEDYLEANKAASFSYTLKVDSNPPFKLPPATAQYYELGTDGVLLSTKSQELEIKIRPPPAAPTPIETPQVETTEQPVPSATPMPGINQLAYNDLDVDINSIPNILLGCDQNDQNNLDFPVIYKACNFFTAYDHDLSGINQNEKWTASEKDQRMYTVGRGGIAWSGNSRMNNVTEDNGNHNIKIGIFADNFDDNDLHGWTTTGGNHSVLNGKYIQETNVVEWVTARPTAFSYSSPSVIMADVNVVDNGTYLDEGLGWGNSTWKPGTAIFAGRRDFMNRWELRRNDVLDNTSATGRTLKELSSLQLYKRSNSYNYYSSYDNVDMSTINSTANLQYPYLLGSSNITQYWDNVRIIPLDSNNNIITSGNLTTWYDAGTGNRTYGLDVKAITPVNTKYSVWYRQNDTGSFVQLGHFYTGNNKIPLSQGYENTDVRIILNSARTKTPELISITFNTIK
ncbi:MAG: hypothetical protein J5U17_08045 [Candidatus Methanoperedens sp.]|nr:hypothetical protein [Candidatus Methanoperedens sp.]